MFYRKHERVSFSCGDVVMTKQAHKAECDINNILKQYQRTGILQHINSLPPSFQDLPDNLDYQQSMNTILAAQEAFASLPAIVRNHFDNNPEAFLRSLTDPKQAPQLREWGILKPLDAAAPPPAPPGATSGAQAQ